MGADGLEAVRQREVGDDGAVEAQPPGVHGIGLRRRIRRLPGHSRFEVRKISPLRDRVGVSLPRPLAQNPSTCVPWWRA